MSSTRYTPDGGGGSGPGGTVVWGPDFGGVDGDRFATTADLTLPSVVLAHAKTATAVLTMPSLALAHSKTAVGHLSGSVLGAPFWQAVTTAAANGTVTSVVCNVPAGVVDGDLLLAFVGANGTATSPDLNTPAGWTLVRHDTITNLHGRVFWRIAAAEPASYTFTTTADANAIVAEIHRIIGTDSTAPVNVHAGATVATTALTPDPVSPSVTTTVVNCLVFTHLLHNHLALTQSHTAPASHLEQSDLQNPGPQFIGSTTCTRVFAAAAATGTATHDCTETVGTDGVMQRIAIAPGVLVIAA